MDTLAEFVHAELKRRNVSAREFARMCGIATGTISAIAAGADTKPTLETLYKLAKGSGADLTVLIDLVYPGTIHALYSPEVLLLARELAALRKSHKSVYEFVVSFVRSQGVSNNGK